MNGFWGNVFNTEGYPARWYCGTWTPVEGWLHIASDTAVWGAYTAIPLVLAYFVLQRKDVPMPKIFWLFALFIFSCGFTHLLDAAMFWWPAYRALGLAKLATALVSWAAVIALIQVTPVALRLPGLAAVNARLERANEDLDHFAHVVSHDLRAPLRSIRQLSQWIREDVDGSREDLEKHLSLLEEKVARMDGLVEGILRYSSASRQGGEMPLERVDAREVLDDALSLVEVPEGMAVRVEGKLPAVVCNPLQLQQIFLNLIHNAVKYMGADTGTITVRGTESATHWTFEVADTGVGIAPENQERIFTMFQTLRPTAGRVGGIGLAVVKRIVDQHGGTIQVRSAPGEGSTFVFTLSKAVMGMRAA